MFELRLVVKRSENKFINGRHREQKIMNTKGRWSHITPYVVTVLCALILPEDESNRNKAQILKSHGLKKTIKKEHTSYS